VIKLRKQKDKYTYLSDNLQQRTKIKIPIEPQIKTEKPIKLKKAAPSYNHVTAASDSGDEFDVDLDPDVTEVLNEITPIQKHDPLIPASSNWFSIDTIHELEKNAMPEYFCGKYPSKTPESYREARNFIINLYRENPSTYLSATSNNLFN
jgi:hypothetical protein